MSNNQVSATANYTAFLTTGAAAVTDLVLVLPSGVTVPGSPTVAVSTASSCTGTFSSNTVGTVAVTGTTIGIPVTSIATLGTCVKVVVNGLTNPSSAGSPYACLADGTGLAINITAGNLSGLSCSSSGLGGTINGLLGIVDNAAAQLTYVTQVVNGVTENLSVAPVLTMGLDNTADSFSITPTASGVLASSATNAITIGTNAQTYTLEAVVSGANSALTNVSNPTATIPLTFQEATGSSPASCPANGTGSGTFGSNGTYQSVQSNMTGLVNSQVTNVDYCWKVDLTKPAGTYTATITYLAVPSF